MLSLRAMAEIDIPASWLNLDVEALNGNLMVVGGVDAGKSTFARYLYTRLAETGRPIAYLDGDPGQSVLGPPTTITLALGRPGRPDFPPQGRIWRRFIGSTTPRGHMLPMAAGTMRLSQEALSAGAATVIHDTSGLIDPQLGGLNLQLALLDLLQPAAVFAIRRGEELEPLLAPLRRSRGVRLFELEASELVRSRDRQTRQAHRAAQFAQYFAEARILEIDWSEPAVWPESRFQRHGLISLEDERGYVLALGLVLEVEHADHRIRILSPLTSLRDVAALRLGNLLLDPPTFRDERPA